MKKGKVWLVGAGPSDAGLFTLKGKSILEQADVVVYDKLVGYGVYSMIPDHAKRINVGKESGNHPIPQHEINKILCHEALEGRKVVRLKGGDPFLFGRGGEELEGLLEQGIEFEVVPGVTSAISVPAYAGIPVTHRDASSSLHIITGHQKAGKLDLDFQALASVGGTLVFLMSVASLEIICNGLLKGGMSPNTPAAIIQNGTTARQRKLKATLADLPEKAEKEEFKTPSIIVVGDVCSYMDELHWAENRPLGKQRVIITRPKKNVSLLKEKLEYLGAEVISLPSIRTVPIDNNIRLHELIKENNGKCKLTEIFKWIVFTSETSVSIFFEELIKNKVDIRALWNLKFAVVGQTTKHAVEQRGILVNYVPEQYCSKALGEGMEKLVGKDEAVLIFTPVNTKNDCARHFDSIGIRYEEIPLYQTEYEHNDTLLLYDDDLVAFTSASTVTGFVNTYKGMDFKKVNAVCIGERTEKEAKKYDMKTIVSENATIDSMVEAILKY